MLERTHSIATDSYGRDNTLCLPEWADAVALVVERLDGQRALRRSRTSARTEWCDV